MTTAAEQAHEFQQHPHMTIEFCIADPRPKEQMNDFTVLCGLRRADPIHRLDRDAPPASYTVFEDEPIHVVPPQAAPPDDDTPKHLKLWICSKCFAPRLYGADGGCYACGTLLHDTAEYHRDDQCQPKSTATTEEAVAYLESINAPITEDRILWAKFLATKPTVEQVNLASSLVIEDRTRHGDALAEALRGTLCVRCNRMIGSPCVPDIMECPVCAAARQALARWEKGES